ncbi:protein NDR1-like [Lotus japonicus]|uniref:protein NDR1-like n=1 Tax=Lotus japonicus TaxID=34305 RepID=UPI00258AD293|nr:protein NDR1-like [Lotus japonicus]
MARRAQRKNCCACCVSFLISTGITCLFLWLTLRTQHPKCYLQSLHIPSLNTTTTNRHNGHHNHPNNTVFFHLKLTNPNIYTGVRYNAVRLAFSVFTDTNTTLPFVDATVDGFYQGHGKTADKDGSAVARSGGVNHTVALAENGMVFVRVEFATEVKYEILSLFSTKRHRLFGGANVEVNASSGEKVGPKGIRLGKVPPRFGSEAAQVRGFRASVLGLFLALFFLTGFT